MEVLVMPDVDIRTLFGGGDMLRPPQNVFSIRNYPDIYAADGSYFSHPSTHRVITKHASNGTVVWTADPNYPWPDGNHNGQTCNPVLWEIAGVPYLFVYSMQTHNSDPNLRSFKFWRVNISTGAVTIIAEGAGSTMPPSTTYVNLLPPTPKEPAWSILAGNSNRWAFVGSGYPTARDPLVYNGIPMDTSGAALTSAILYQTADGLVNLQSMTPSTLRIHRGGVVRSMVTNFNIPNIMLSNGVMNLDMYSPRAVWGPNHVRLGLAQGLYLRADYDRFLNDICDAVGLPRELV